MHLSHAPLPLPLTVDWIHDHLDLHFVGNTAGTRFDASLDINYQCVVEY